MEKWRRQRRREHRKIWSNLLPESRNGCIDRNLIQILGLDAACMKENSALFFYQLILPICSVIKSVINKDTRKYYYSEVDKWINIYADQISIGGAYSKKLEHIIIYELV